MGAGAMLHPHARVHAAAAVPVDPADTAPSTSSFLPLDETQAKLKLVQVVFRHGARTPLSPRAELWTKWGATWDAEQLCGCAYDAVPVAISSAVGDGRPDNEHNSKQINKVLNGGCHAGQLTKPGQVQALELGQWLRGRYVQRFGFLPDGTELAGLLKCRTTNFERTIGTLRGVLTGLLPEGAAKKVSVPCVTSSDLDEILYADSKQCPHLGTFMKMSKAASKDLVKRDHEYAWAREELGRVMGLPPSFFDAKDWAFVDVHDVVTSITASGQAGPPGFSSRLEAAVSRLATKEFAPYVAPSINDKHGQTLLRLGTGVLLHTLVSNMESALQQQPAAAAAPSKPAQASSQAGKAGPAGSKQAQAAPNSSQQAPSGPLMYLYSGHDSSLMPILAAFGLDLHAWPPFVSNIVIELWEVPAAVPAAAAGSAPGSKAQQSAAAQHVVRVMYNQSELDIPHCPRGRYATLATFKHEVLGPFLLGPDQVSEACKVPMAHDSSMPQPASMAQRPDDEE
eukprot:CAMPEP_0202870166 /NCGR_PEP_ID=MMETSP1391-20130828/14819_1 /ASSEMBLY_ACC=CAM_ASM_000867 /TAXON_ID=1034604 /ORGANISM="Chlamydomonas leiostraca, Strain SAG 11-49" /LENGTH=509 /DNA_ID=CAMNT_0049550657 /DNA_START=81 /DNA_END=1610 /DNA_ORIENTATION=-